MQVSGISFNSPAAVWNRMAKVTRLLFKSARVGIEFTGNSWKQLLQHNPSPASAFLQAINIRADLAFYIVAHEEMGVFMDTECQEICYQPGLYLIIRKEHGIWYITDVITTDDGTGFAPVYIWTRIRRGFKVVTARVLIRWRRLTKRIQGNETTSGGKQLPEY